MVYLMLVTLFSHITNSEVVPYNYTLNLESISSYIYSISVNIGNPSQSMNLILDTHKSVSMLCGRECYNCKSGNVFDRSLSSTYKTINATYSVVAIRDQLEGLLGTDEVAISDFKITNNIFIIKAIQSQRNLYIDGQLGLGPSRVKEDHLVHNLKSNKLIEKAIFSLLYKSELPKLYLGHYDPKITGNSLFFPIKYTDATETFTEWYIEVDSIEMGGSVINGTQRLVVGTANYNLIMPKSFFDTNKHIIFNKSSKCEFKSDNLFHCKCDHDTVFPHILFSLYGITVLEYKTDDYVNSELNDADMNNNCKLSISLNYKNDYWIIGSALLKNYYTVFDLEGDKIAFRDIRTYPFNFAGDMLIYMLVVLFCSTIFFILIYVVYRKVSNTRGGYSRVEEEVSS
jgi:hypothetical protein